MTAGEISSDRQTLKMNDFLKQIEAYSNDKLDKFMPQMTSSSSHQPNAVSGGLMPPGQQAIMGHQAKLAEDIRIIID